MSHSFDPFQFRLLVPQGRSSDTDMSSDFDLCGYDLFKRCAMVQQAKLNCDLIQASQSNVSFLRFKGGKL